MFAKILNASLRICYTGDTIDKHLYAREQWLLINEKYNILKTLPFLYSWVNQLIQGTFSQ
jgi:hypothetical protein